MQLRKYQSTIQSAKASQYYWSEWPKNYEKYKSDLLAENSIIVGCDN